MGFQSRSFKRGSRGFDGLRSSWWLLSFQWLQFLGQFYGVLDVSTCLNMNIIQETLENHNKTIPFFADCSSSEFTKVDMLSKRNLSAIAPDAHMSFLLKTSVDEPWFPNGI